MTSLTRAFTPVFADTIEQGDLLAADMQGSHPYKVLTEPVRVRNLVGSGVYVQARVQLMGTDQIGTMIYPASRCVYRSATQDAQTPV